MWTIGRMSRHFALSRSTLLYYDEIDLLNPSGRDLNGYRLYGPEERARMERITVLREAGVPLKKIRRVLAGDASKIQTVLEQRLSHINREIGALRTQQSLILRLLQTPASQQGGRVMNKDRWVEILDAAGIDDAGKWEWHAAFERLSPDGHQDFLESLGIDAEEIRSIRHWSRQASDHQE
ncbi:MAG: MerR family transcriptional regulator [Magnetococcales bacterium]|nr:MerR family transcriptional regulator [Magnetococcales bacterium]